MAENGKNNTLPLKTAIVGAAVGAAAVMLSQKKVRDQITKNAKKIMDSGEKTLNSAIKKAERTTDKVTKEIEKKV